MGVIDTISCHGETMAEIIFMENSCTIVIKTVNETNVIMGLQVSHAFLKLAWSYVHADDILGCRQVT